MPSPAAVDRLQLNGWEREPHAYPNAFDDDDTNPYSARAMAFSGEIFPDEAWPARSLNEALAELGPAQPQMQAAAEAWSRAGQLNEHNMPEAAEADAHCGSVNGKLERVVEAAPIPPPPRPRVARQAPAFELAEELRAPIVDNLSQSTLAEFDYAGVELVQALATADAAWEPLSAQAPLSMPAVDADELMGRSPMIIERARAQQELGVLPALPAVSRGSPFRGLAIGFALSLFAGAGLYAFLAGG